MTPFRAAITAFLCLAANGAVQAANGAATTHPPVSPYLVFGRGNMLDWRPHAEVEGAAGVGTYDDLSCVVPILNTVDMGNSFFLAARAQAGYGPIALGFRIDEVWKRGSEDVSPDSFVANNASRNTAEVFIGFPAVIGREGLLLEPRVGYAWMNDKFVVKSNGGTSQSERANDQGLSIGARGNLSIWYWIRGVVDVGYSSYRVPERRYSAMIELNTDASLSDWGMRKRNRAGYPGKGFMRIGIEVKSLGAGRRATLFVLSLGFHGATEGNP